MSEIIAESEESSAETAKRRKRISCFKRGTFRDCKGQHRLSDSSDDMGKRNPESKSENRELFVRKRIILWHTENLPPATSLAYFVIPKNAKEADDDRFFCIYTLYIIHGNIRHR